MKSLSVMVAVCLLSVGFGSMSLAGDAPSIQSAIAVLHPTMGHKVTGTVRFDLVPGGVRVSGQIEGLKPGEHGFHIHEFGDCSAPDAESAGGHFNPQGMQHGPRHADHRHVGDLGNVKGDRSGRAVFDFVDKQLALSAILGRAVVVHADLDDLKTQPAGNAGARVACGVVAIAKPADPGVSTGGKF